MKVETDPFVPGARHERDSVFVLDGGRHGEAGGALGVGAHDKVAEELVGDGGGHEGSSLGLGGDAATGDVGEVGAWELSAMRAELVQLGELLACSAEADLQPFDLSRPAVAVRLIDAGV